ncbi:hypothetical protein XELAEV_18023600mg [Xenopus laevis]|uniref:Uncharacterized protein n=1 Tax=Xenopus laevis TaxID=8355 RepID=A0A974D4F6_XENLA|nr:hypothetical protein XELAEV_18023600mg [Xenopus laevis]
MFGWNGTQSEAQCGTFAYTESEAAEIVAGFAGPIEFLHQPNVSLKRKQLETIQNRFVDLELHGLTLAEYHRKQWIPRCLRVTLRPTLFANNDYCARFAQILNECSTDIIILTLEHIKKELVIVQSEMTKLEEEMGQGCVEEEFSTLKQQLVLKLDRYRKEGEKQKRSKYDRDSQDYLKGRNITGVR